MRDNSGFDAVPTETKKCPFCAELIKTKAIKCKHCGSLLTEAALCAFARELDQFRQSPAAIKSVPTPGPVRPTVSDISPAQPAAAKRSLATILFADLSGFTELSRTREPEEIHVLMNALFSDLNGAIERYGGTVDKYIGDCVMAVWGIDVSHEDDAGRATPSRRVCWAYTISALR